VREISFPATDKMLVAADHRCSTMYRRLRSQKPVAHRVTLRIRTPPIRIALLGLQRTASRHRSRHDRKQVAAVIRVMSPAREVSVGYSRSTRAMSSIRTFRHDHVPQVMPDAPETKRGRAHLAQSDFSGKAGDTSSRVWVAKNAGAGLDLRTSRPPNRSSPTSGTNHWTRQPCRTCRGAQ